MKLIMKPVCESQIGADFPGILGIELELVILEVAFLAGTIWKHRGGFIVVKIREDTRIPSEEEGKEIIPVRNGRSICRGFKNVGRTKGGVERTKIAAQANSNEIEIILER